MQSKWLHKYRRKKEETLDRPLRLIKYLLAEPHTHRNQVVLRFSRNPPRSLSAPVKIRHYHLKNRVRLERRQEVLVLPHRLRLTADPSPRLVSVMIHTQGARDLPSQRIWI